MLLRTSSKEYVRTLKFHNFAVIKREFLKMERTFEFNSTVYILKKVRDFCQG